MELLPQEVALTNPAAEQDGWARWSAMTLAGFGLGTAVRCAHLCAVQTAVLAIFLTFGPVFLRPCEPCTGSAEPLW